MKQHKQRSKAKKTSSQKPVATDPEKTEDSGSETKHPYDIGSKLLPDTFPKDWIQFLKRRIGLEHGFSFKPAKEEHFSIKTSQQDRLYEIIDDKNQNSDRPQFLHLEIEANKGSDLHQRALWYYIQSCRFYEWVSVTSILILLRREADSPKLTGVYTLLDANGQVNLTYRYFVIRVWELKSDDLIEGPLGTMPLALLTDDAKENMDHLIQRINERTANCSENYRDTLISSSFLLAGMVYNKPEEILQLFERFNGMEETLGYQLIFGRGKTEGKVEGKAEGILETLIILGTKRFGKPTKKILKQLENIQSADELQELFVNCLDAESWNQLLQSAQVPK